jgi:hypothetical protein
MAEAALFLNSGPLFNGERLESLEETPEWENVDAAARTAYERVRELFEKHSTLLAGSPSADETRYYMVAPTLHALSYTHSVHEPIALGDGHVGRVDFVCFASAAEFYEGETNRGGLGLFRPSITLVKSVSWGASPDVEAVPVGEDGFAIEGADPVLPALELHEQLQTTGRDYGILTNGCDWRLYHRGTSGQVNTYFQADMIACMKSGYEDFKRFFMLFGCAAVVRDDSGTCFLDRMLQ